MATLHRLPRLRSLHFELIQSGLAVLDRFAGCPLTRLAVVQSRISTDAWIAFLRARKFPDLRTLALGERDDDDFAELKGECALLGIAFEVLEGDAFDDDEDEDEDEGEDGEDDDEDDFGDGADDVDEWSDEPDSDADGDAGDADGWASDDGAGV